MTPPRVLVEGVTSLPRTRWRVVLVEKQDSHGVLRESRIIELADEQDTDAMGVQRWRQLTMKSAHSEWQLVCEAALNLILEERHVTETV